MAKEFPAYCVEHLLTDKEREHLTFMVNEDAQDRETRQFEWFASKHLGLTHNARPSTCVHLADVVLCALQIAETLDRKRPTLWSWLWKLAGDPTAAHSNSQAHLAFVFAARKPGYARQSLQSVLDASTTESRRSLIELAQRSFPTAIVLDIVNAITIKGQKAKAPSDDKADAEDVADAASPLQFEADTQTAEVFRRSAGSE